MTSTPALKISPITREDIPTLLGLVHELADFERLGHEVTATATGLEKAFCSPTPQAGGFIAWKNQKAIGFAVYYKTFSTFVGRPGLFLEDLYVRQEHRGSGIGRQLLQAVGQVAKAMNAGRFEWWALEWNHSAIEFYQTLGAKLRDDWRLLRMTSNGINELSSKRVLCEKSAGVPA